MIITNIQLIGLNSTMVRLQLGLQARIYEETLQCLNSTMVRLQLVIDHPEWSHTFATSQFHYGSITTNKQHRKEIEGDYFVSIPLWFDYNNSLEYKVIGVYKDVSIPLWFDYNSNKRT